MIKDFLVKLGITIVVSILIGVSIGPFVGFWSGFGIGFALQIFGNFIYQNFITSKQQIELERILNERMEIVTSNSVQFPCPCGAKQFNEFVIINDDNIFSCERCGQLIKLNIQFTPTVITTPLDNEKQLEKLNKLTPELEIL